MQQGNPTYASTNYTSKRSKLKLLKKVKEDKKRIKRQDPKIGKGLKLPATPHNTTQYLMGLHLEAEKGSYEEWGSMLPNQSIALGSWKNW